MWEVVSLPEKAVTYVVLIFVLTKVLQIDVLEEGNAMSVYGALICGFSDGKIL